MKKSLKNLTILSLIVVVFLSFSGCSLSSKGNTSNSKTQNTKNQTKGDPTISEDKKRTDDLKKNKDVSNAMVYTQKGNAIATMIIKDNVSANDAKALAEDYAKQLKKQYPTMKVNVQAVQNGKNIANVNIDK